MDREELVNFIDEHNESDDFTGGVDETQITLVQNELGVELPESFKWFLTTYGSGGLFGVDILGMAKSNRAPVVINTQRYIELGMEKDLVIIKNVGEYVYCLYFKQNG
ncbi:SMI1/KNR4 family protein [Psychrobacillus sp. NPDC093180]|uniref:SMI1/KNR4 family protein n=1 Tax=Psychrobacillus sp. NPDC093180 TaxID=3364489 RepID=UPI00382189FE